MAASSAADERFAQAQEALLEAQGVIMMRHLGLPRLFGAMSDPDAAQDKVEVFWAAWERGEVVPVDSEEWQWWNGLRRGVEEQRDAHPFSRLGLRRDDPTMTSLFTCMFVHDGGLHLVFNMLFLWAVGVNLEETWGRSLFALAYLLGGLCASAAWLASAPRGEGQLVVGASGAVAAIMGAFAVRHFFKKIRFFSLLPTPAVYALPGGFLLVPWFIGELHATTRDGAADEGVAFAAHVGGFVAGAGLAFAVKAMRAEHEIAPTLKHVDRQLEKREHVARADETLRLGDARAGLASLALAAAADPDDLALRLRKLGLQRTLGDPAGAAAESLALLPKAWRGGDRAFYLELFRIADDVSAAQRPAPSDVHRAAVALETRDARTAAELHVRVFTDSPTDPAAAQSLRRCAALYERHGHVDAAAKLRARLPP
jgi:membrane associated rhomboid family serine protease